MIPAQFESSPWPISFEWSKLCVEISGAIEPGLQPGQMLLWFKENFFTATVEGFFLGDFSISAKRATLVLPLINARMPLDSRAGVAALPSSLSVTFAHKTTETKTAEKAGASKVSGGLTQQGASLTLEGQQSKAGHGKGTESSVNGADVLPTYVAGGSASQPTWLYEAKGANPILLGSLGRRVLGELSIERTPFTIRFQLRLRARDAQFNGLSRLLPSTIANDPNKMSITRALIWNRLRSQVEPFLIDEAIEVVA
jgi:hypothetical protein